MTSDPHADLRDRVLRTVRTGAGETDPALRKAVAEGEGVPAELHALVDKIHRHAWRVTDEDVAQMRALYSDDALFEVIVNAALGASWHRLRTGLEALERT